MLKGQDIVVLAALMGTGPTAESYAELGKRTCISVSETHAAIKRLQAAALLGADRRLLRRNVLEFLVHGLRYTFPFRQSGGMGRGMPTSYAAPVAQGAFVATGYIPVWNSPDGSAHGLAYEPLYPTAPKAAAANADLYDRLAVLDMLRGGRLRERLFAEEKIKGFIG